MLLKMLWTTLCGVLSGMACRSLLSRVRWVTQRLQYDSRPSAEAGTKRVRLVYDESRAQLSIEDDDGIKLIFLDSSECELLGEHLFLVGRQLAQVAEES